MSIKLVEATHVDGLQVNGYDADSPSALFKRLLYLEKDAFDISEWQFKLVNRLGKVVDPDWTESARYEYKRFLASQVKKKNKTRKK